MQSMILGVNAFLKVKLSAKNYVKILSDQIHPIDINIVSRRYRFLQYHNAPILMQLEMVDRVI